MSILKLLFWFVFWPIPLSIWMWRQGGLGKAIFGAFWAVCIYTIALTSDTAGTDNLDRVQAQFGPTVSSLAVMASTPTMQPTSKPTSVRQLADDETSDAEASEISAETLTSSPTNEGSVAPIVLLPTATPTPQTTQSVIFVEEPTATKQPTLSKEPPATAIMEVQMAAPSCAQIVQFHRDFTSVQWNDYRDGLEDTWIESWSGRVNDVGGWSLLDMGYPVHIDVSPDCYVKYVAREEAEAMEFALGQQIQVSGQINSVITFLGEIIISLDRETTSVGAVAEPLHLAESVDVVHDDGAESAKYGVSTAANLRSGPGTDYAVVGSLQAGASVDIVACNQACDWYQLSSGAWIAAFLVEGSPSGLPIIVPPAATQPVADSPSPVATVATETVSSPHLKEIKYDGFYLVGVDIAPGTWESTGNGTSCYWKRSDRNQNIIDNHLGLAGGTMTIQPTDFEVELNRCGAWVNVDGRQPVLQPDATAPKGDGFYTVGVEIASGTWRSSGPGDFCYWKRSDRNQNIIDNHLGMAGGAVTIQPTDYEVELNRCGFWEYLGP